MSNQLPTQQPPSPPSSHTHSRGSSLTMRVGTFKRYNNLSPRLANEIKQAVRVTQYTVALPQRERSKERISRLFTLPSRTSITFTPPPSYLSLVENLRFVASVCGLNDKLERRRLSTNSTVYFSGIEKLQVQS